MLALAFVFHGGSAYPANFNGIYTQDFNAVFANHSSATVDGFRMLSLAGDHATFNAANPISAGAIGAAVAVNPQSINVWDFGSPAVTSPNSLYNVGSMGDLTDRALGTDPSLVAGVVIELSLTNATGASVPGVNFSYDLRVLTNGSVGTEAGELPGYAFFYSLTGGTNAADWIPVSSLSLSNYISGTTTNSGSISLNFPAPLLAGNMIYFRWADDNNQANSPDQMLAIDNIVISVSNNIPPNLPVVVSPLPGATGVTNHSALTVTVSDPNLDPLSVTFYGRVAGTGNFSVIDSVYGVHSGANANCIWYGMVTNTTYEWYVIATDGAYSSTNALSQFTTTTNFPQIPPVVSLSSPAKNVTLGSPANVVLTANASDPDGMVTNVAFYVGGSLIVNDPASPYAGNWFGAPAGIYPITAVATDDNGLMTTSSVVTITLTNSVAVQTLQQIQTVFVIGMENHCFTQPNPTANPQQIFGNPAAPYLNSLITAGNSNAAQVSFATKYYGGANGLHPSEPNYVWAEAGTDFGVETSADPSPGNGNLFDAPHLTRQLNAAGVAWKNYQEDVEYTLPEFSSIGNGTTNVFYGTASYYYAAKHNPMTFFTDSQHQNVYPLTNLYNDLASNSVGRYNWITPNMYNDQHSALPAGFTYRGTSYVNDQAGVAQGDNFLATIIPIIMASRAYQSNGVIIIRWDETETGEGVAYTLPAIVISPLAKGNAYACNVEMDHSSVVRTMEELFALPLLTNTIPARLAAPGGGVNSVTLVNDLSDMFMRNASTNTVTSNPGTNNPVNGLTGRMVPGHGFQLSFSGTSNQAYRVFASDSFAVPSGQWPVISTGTFNGSNVLFPDMDASNHASRFYFIKSP